MRTYFSEVLIGASPELIGASPEMVELSADIDRVARSDAKVLITGESGVGKEMVGRAIHGRSPRAARPFVAVNCGGLPEGVLESELFGDATSSVRRDTPAKLELADQGTVFLKGIGEMSMRLQGLLLRFLETGQLLKAGTDRDGRSVDVRLIAASNRDLHQIVAMGMFRDDLFYRLNAIRMAVPPLRTRKADIPILVDHFLQRCTRVEGCVVRSISSAAMTLLTQYSWPGNVRELERVIERLTATSRSTAIGPEELPVGIRVQQGAAARPRPERHVTIVDDLYKRLVEDRESFWSAVYPLYMQRDITRANVRDLVRKGLQEARGNYTIVARLFNLTPTDYKRFLSFLRKHDCQLPFKEYRQ